ncbi:MAG: hypothetical protein R3C44_07430 [Chloroflexota bacterium]
MTTISAQKQAGISSWMTRYRLPLLMAVAVLAILIGVVPAQGSTIPTFSIVSVVADESVTIETYNYPANQNFVVTMGPMGTQGIDGVVVATTNSGAGGSFRATYMIPEALKGSYQIAIRMQTTQAYPYYAYNWFYNNTATSAPGKGGQPVPLPAPIPSYSGIPTFRVCSVAQNQTVTVKTSNFPANQTFTVTMGPFGTQGIGGYVVGTMNSGVGGELVATFNIPAELVGYNLISIRAQTAQAYPFYAYNWFWNTTATVC